MKSLFDKTNIKGMELKNRFIRSATHEGLADKHGEITDQYINFYENLARGGVSTIITGFAYTLGEEPSSPGMLGAYNDRLIDGFIKLTETVHKYNANIVLQVAEGGSQARFNNKKRTIYGPSLVEHKYTRTTPEEMTEEDIKKLINAFGDAALRAKNSGFDGIQMHAAHGYLLSQFLTPYYNRRTDKYGGNTEKRARIIFEAYENMREKAGDDFPILIKINCRDFMEEEGLKPDETRFICKKLGEYGIDLIEISGNVGFNQVFPEIIQADINKAPSRQCYFSEYARIIAEETNTPISVVGGNRDFKLIDNLLKTTNIEYFSLSRTLLCEPELINKWQENPDYEPKCLSCNKCFSLKGNMCIFNRGTIAIR